MMKEIIKVQGMSCGHCVNSIEGSVGELAGVSVVKANLDRSEVSVTFDTEKTSLTLIKEAIVEQGYEIV